MTTWIDATTEEKNAALKKAGAVTRVEKVTITETGEFNCICGNYPNAGGADSCDCKGNLVEPTPDDWPDDLYRCARCGRVFNGDTGEVITQVEKGNL